MIRKNYFVTKEWSNSKNICVPEAERLAGVINSLGLSEEQENLLAGEIYSYCSAVKKAYHDSGRPQTYRSI